MKKYIVFYYDSNNVEQSIEIEAVDRFKAKFIAFDTYNIPLKSISRVL